MSERRPGNPAGSPSTSTRPEATICTPTIERISVDLPHPLGPSRPVMRPAATSTDTPSSTRCPPRLTTRSRMLIAASFTATQSRRAPMIDLGWRHHHLLTKGVHRPRTADLHIMREREVTDAGGMRFGTKLHFVPGEGAEIEGEKIRVAFTADQVNNAPNISADESLTPSEEEQLFHHYGMDGHDGTTTILVVWVATG